MDLIEPAVPSGRSVRIRVGFGAGVVLVLVAAAIAVLISAVSSHPAAASVTAYSSGSSGSSEPSTTHSSSSSDDASAAAPAAATAFVQVVGEVQRPGLYELPTGDRLVDAVAAAGGFTANADQASLNLAQVIADGEQIIVGARGAVVAGVAPGAPQGPGGGPVDINTANETTLETLDGIGPALAQRIISYRTAHGGFRTIGDLQNVTGIGPKKYAAIKGSVST